MFYKHQIRTRIASTFLLNLIKL